MAAAVDVHFLTLAAAQPPNDALDVLMRLRGRIADDLRISERVATLGGAMAHIHRLAPLPTYSAAAAHTYSVELLDLSVRGPR
jgi:hypothetical protein